MRREYPAQRQASSSLILAILAAVFKVKNAGIDRALGNVKELGNRPVGDEEPEF